MTNLITNLFSGTKEMEKLGGLHTALEIEGQPALWQEVYDLESPAKKVSGIS